MLQQHGGADGLANGFAVGLADISAVAEPVAPAFREPDGKSLGVAERFAFRVAIAKSVGVPKRDPGLCAIRSPSPMGYASCSR